MVADASIYGMIRPQQPMQGPLEQYAQIAQVKNLMGQGQLQDLQMKQAQSTLDAEERVRNLFAGGKTPTAAEAISASPSFGVNYQKSLLESRAKEMEILSKATSLLKDRLPTVRDEGSYQAYVEQAKQLLGPEKVSQLGLPPAFDPEWVKRQLVESKELFTPKMQVVEMPDGSKKTVDMNPFTNPQAVNFNAPPSMTPTERARVAELQGHNLEMERIAGAGLHYNTGIQMPQRNPAAINAAAAPRQPTAAPAAAPASTPTPAPVTPGITPKAAAEQAAKEAERTKEVGRTLNAYVAARNGLLSGLAGSQTGAISGRIPAFTSGQQIAEGGVAAMAPVLKQLFRVAGEGVFTDRDQQLLLDMVPTRSDNPGARKAKMENIDRIVAAKLGMEVPKYVAPKDAPKGGGIDPSQMSDDELRRELGL